MNPETPPNGAHAPPKVPLATLFGTFLRLGLTAFGGPAMVWHIRALAAERRRWITEEDFRLGLSLCQMIPGATAMQVAAFVGFRLRGLAGALAAFVGFGLPAFGLITALSFFYFRYQNVGWILATFASLKTVVVAIIASAALDFVRKYTACFMDALIGFGSACGVLLQVPPALIVVAATLLGAVAYGDAPAAACGAQASAPANQRNACFRLLAGLGLLVGLLAAYSTDLAGLALRMMRVDLFAFGGGFAALPMMLHEVVRNAGWLTEKTFLDGIALGQITPGPIVITSAFVGYAVQGVVGAAAAAIGMFAPSITLLVWAVPRCDSLLGSAAFRRALRACLATLGGLMAAMVVVLARPVAWSPANIGLCLCAFGALRLRVDILWVVLGGVGASLGLLFSPG
ncbi:chromate efflux transporter [Fundidesulfovibrio butyratiphilus]